MIHSFVFLPSFEEEGRLRLDHVQFRSHTVDNIYTRSMLRK